MPRPNRDGTPARPPNKRRLTELYVRKHATPGLTWDEVQRGLVMQVQPTGHRSWKCIYSFDGRARWYYIGAVDAIGLADARRLARGVMVRVAEGYDPQAERKARRSAGTFAELADRYINEHAKRKNKSWRQSHALVTKHLIPRWGKLQAANISRDDVKAAIARIEAPVLANQVRAAASAIFAWAVREGVGAIKLNPCVGVANNEVKSRERVLSDGELPQFWAAFGRMGMQGAALKLILLTGQRPGEVSHMRSEHIEAGWWTMPGEPVPALDWKGTKNGATHRVWLPKPALALVNDLSDDGFVLQGQRGRAITRLDEAMRAICTELGINDKATPHDLRRTHGTTIAALGFGRDVMNRIQNHREGGIATVYDRHGYGPENQRVMEAVASQIMTLAEGANMGNVILGTFR